MFMTVKQFHKALNGSIGENTIRQYERTGLIKSHRVGRKILISAAEVQDFPRRLFGG